jgi:DNA replication protein DnaC
LVIRVSPSADRNTFGSETDRTWTGPINERYLERRPILVTTNKPLAALGDVLHDGDLAEAILDRLLERGTHFALRGRSYRTRHLSEEDAPTRRSKTA